MKELNCCVDGSFSASKAAMTEDALSMVIMSHISNAKSAFYMVRESDDGRWDVIQLGVETSHVTGAVSTTDAETEGLGCSKSSLKGSRSGSRASRGLTEIESIHR